MAWKDRLRRGTFRGVPFHYEAIDRSGGRGTAVHNFPKANKHYTEDMGRRERVFNLSVYVIGPLYTVERDALIAALEADGPGQLVIPTGGGGRYIASSYNATESRLEGGMCIFDIEFIEAGAPAMAVPVADTGSMMGSMAQAAIGAALGAASSVLSGGSVAGALSGIGGAAVGAASSALSSTVGNAMSGALSTMVGGGSATMAMGIADRGLSAVMRQLA